MPTHVCALLLMSTVTACTFSDRRAGTRDCAYCPEMVVVQAGTAILGAAPGDPFSNADEMPERTFATREAIGIRAAKALRLS